MFERFTDRARRAMALAQEEAQRHHSGVGTEHLLLGLIEEGEGVAAKALQALGISLESVSQQIQEIIGPAKPPPSRQSRFSPRARQVLKLSLREALQLGHHYIGTEHLLLGLMREGEGVAAQVLVKLGADLSGVRQQVIQVLQGYQGQEEPKAGRTAPRPGGARPGQPGTLAEILRGVNSIDSRLSAMQQSVGAGPAGERPRRADRAGRPGQGICRPCRRLRTRRTPAGQGKTIARREVLTPGRMGRGASGPFIPGRGAPTGGRRSRAASGAAPPARRRSAGRRRVKHLCRGRTGPGPRRRAP